VETAYWSLASWKAGLELDLRGKLPTAAVGLPGGVPEQPGADDAAKKKIQDHVGYGLEARRIYSVN